MWAVFEEKNIKKQLAKAPSEIKKKYEFWKSVAQMDGPAGLRRLPGFRDHALKGEWQGSRSSYLNIQWRVIYSVEGESLKIFVLEVNPHDYRKKN